MNESKQEITVIMVVHDQAQELEQNLPQFMTIAEDIGCRVIVVDHASTDETPDVLKRMKEYHPTLYTTFLPLSPDMKLNKMRAGYALGIKASKANYIVLADINRPPLSAAWIEGMVADGEPVAMVFCHPKNGKLTFMAMQTVEEAAPYIRKAERKSGQGHKGEMMKLKRGIYDALAVRRECVFDVLKYFGEDVKGLQLAALRMSIFMKHLFL